MFGKPLLFKLLGRETTIRANRVVLYCVLQGIHLWLWSGLYISGVSRRDPPFSSTIFWVGFVTAWLGWSLVVTIAAKKSLQEKSFLTVFCNLQLPELIAAVAIGVFSIRLRF